MWLAGGSLGLQSLERSSTLDALKAATAGMDVVVVALAAAFTFRWGRRVPAAAVLLPMWVGTGLLGVVAVGFPLVGLAQAVSGGALVADTTDALVEPWVYTVVYSGFAVQGIALLTAFWLYASDRWSSALRGRIGARPAVVALRAVLDPLTNGAALAAVGLAGVHLSWGSGSTAGLSPTHIAARDLAAQTTDLVQAVFVLAAVAGLLLLVRGWAPSCRLWVATLLAWAGSAAMFAWGSWTTVVTVVGGAGLTDGSSVDATGIVGVVRFGLGTVMGIALLLALAERRVAADIDRTVRHEVTLAATWLLSSRATSVVPEVGQRAIHRPPRRLSRVSRRTRRSSSA